MFTLINTALLIAILVIVSRKKIYVHLDDHKSFEDRNRRK